VNPRRALVALAVAAGLVAGGLFYAGAQRVSAIVAAADLPPGRALAPGDLEVRELPPDALPAGVIGSPSAAVGSYLRLPLQKGQLVLASALASSSGAFDSGIVPPTGYSAIAIPVEAAQAVGGAVVPGARVNVIAVPVAGRAPPELTTELLVAAALVVDVRGEQGGPFERRTSARTQAGVARERLGSVVIAVGPSQELAIAERIPTSTFVLVLVADRR